MCDGSVEPQLDELAILSRLAAGVGPAAPEPVCRLRGLIFACELLCHLGEATSALGLARSLAPDLAFQPELAPWRQHPEELETWRMDWANTAELEEATRGHRAQLKAILERAGLQNCG